MGRPEALGFEARAALLYGSRHVGYFGTKEAAEQFARDDGAAQGTLRWIGDVLYYDHWPEGTGGYQ